MTPAVLNFNNFLALGTVVMQLLAVILLLSWWLKKSNPLMTFFSRHAFVVAWLIALGGAIFSLVYSDGVGFEPCELCWYQRIFLYPIVVILGIAMWKKDESVRDYVLGLSGIGALIAAFHYYGQMFNPGALPCEAIDGVSACAQRFFVTFGYITIPMMSFSAFFLIISLMLVRKRMTR